MKRNITAILLTVVTLLLGACGTQETSIDTVVTEEESEDNEYTAESSNNESEIVEDEMLYDYPNATPLLSEFDVNPQSDKIWCLDYSNRILLQTDLTGEIYNKFQREDATSAEAALTDERILFRDGDEYYVYDFEMNMDVTEEYTGGDKTICYANDECIFLLKKEETYNSQNTYMYILDNKGNEKLSFSTNEMSEKYNVEWERNWKYGACGSHIYYIQVDGIGENCCFIDLQRNKAYISSNLPVSNSGSIFSDGEYIVDFQPHHGQVVINCDTEKVSELENDSYYHVNGLINLSEGKVLCIGEYDSKAYLNVDGTIALDLSNYEDTSVTDASQFENGYAMLEFNDKFTTIIDTKGNFLFEPVKGSIYKLLNVNGTNCYIIYNDDLYYFLDETGTISEPFTKNVSMYIMEENGEELLIAYDEGKFSIIPTE